MSGGSGMETMMPMLMMQQAARIDPLYYGQSYVDNISQTIMDTMAGSTSSGQQTGQTTTGVTSSVAQQSQDSQPSDDERNKAMMDAMNYVNSITAYIEPQHYAYLIDSSGKKTRTKKQDATAEDTTYYDEHETDAAALDQLKEWNKKRKSPSTASTSTSGGTSLLSGSTDLEALFASLLGGGK